MNTTMNPPRPPTVQPTPPFLPAVGWRFVTLSCKPNGKIDTSHTMTVLPYGRFSLSSHEFAANGCRYDAHHLFENGETGYGGVAVLTRFPLTTTLYVGEDRIAEAKVAMRARWLEIHREALVHACDLVNSVNLAVAKHETASQNASK